MSTRKESTTAAVKPSASVMVRKIGSGARRGEQLLRKLHEASPEIWYRGERVKDVTTHPAFKNGVHSLAALYDLQWERPDVMLFGSPTTG
ncbi:MAG TPA: 4-hydroxyphenylacetate 3-hydroxylase N-terminal domain-containing protein, partial [Bacteroidota bacterium]